MLRVHQEAEYSEYDYLVRGLEHMRDMGLCTFCHKPYNPDESNARYGHDVCADQFERELDRQMIIDLIKRCPPGTRFDLAGGAACD